MIGKPQPSEAAPYYFTYIDKVNDDDIVQCLSNQLEPTLAFCSKISEERSLYRYASDKWSIRQTLSHVTDAERLFAFRAFWFARVFDAPLPSFDQNVAVASAAADSISWNTHIEDFRRVRLSTLSLFENMPSDAWMRSGIASDNPFTVRALAYLMAGHVTHHIRIISDRYLGFSAQP